MQVERPYLRDMRAEAVRQLHESGEWLIAGVESNVPWPKVAQVVEFDGLDFILRPGDESTVPSIVVNSKRYGLSRQDAQDKVLKLASALAWEAGQKLEVFSWLSGSRPFGIGKWQGNIVQDFISSQAIPSPSDSSVWVPLALFREGVSASNPFYSFLNFYKVISAIYRDGRTREKWFRGALLSIDDDRAKSRIDELNQQGIEVGHYLVSEGRHAIAHAEKESFVNPGCIVDYARIQSDLPVIRALAEHAIEECYGLVRNRSNLAYPESTTSGMRRILGDDLVARLTNDQPIDDKTMIQLPDGISVVARRGAEFHAYQGMMVDQVVQVQGGVRMRLTDAAKLIQFSVEFNLLSQELLFSPLEDMGRVVDHDSVAGIERDLDFFAFQWCMIGNGRLELWNEETNELLGRSDAFIPCNMMPDQQKHDEFMAALNDRKSTLEGEAA